MGRIAKRFKIYFNRDKIFDAIKNGDLKTLDKLIPKGKQSFPSLLNKYGWTPLMQAIRFNRLDIIDFLIERGVDVNEPGSGDNSKPIYFALNSKNGKILEKLIKAGAEVNTQYQYGYSPLHSAATHNNYEAVKILLKHGATVNQMSKPIETPLPDPDDYPDKKCYEEIKKHTEKLNSKKIGDTPIFSAINRGNSDILRLLIDAGADVNGESNIDRSPLFRAIRDGDKEKVRLLLENGADVNITNDEGETALHSAALYGNKEILELLLDYNVDINNRMKDDKTPILMLATGFCDDTEIFKLFVDRGADIYIKDNNDSTVLEHLAGCEKYKDKVINYFISTGYKPQNIRDAIICSSKEKVDEFLKADPEAINKENHFKKTPLILAVIANNMDMVQHLISRGAKVGMVTGNGKTALHYAETVEMAEYLISCGAKVVFEKKDVNSVLYPLKPIDVMDFLISRGADVNLPDETTSILSIAVILKQPGYYIKYLIEREANLEDKTPGNMLTPLQWAIFTGYTDAVKALVEAGANLNIKGKISGNTPLHAASESGYSKIVKILIDCGANTEERNKDYQTPLHEAVWGFTNNRDSNKKETIKFLLEAGANINAKDKYNWTPLNYAVWRWNDDIAEYLKANGGEE